MNCQAAKELLSPFLDRELHEPESRELTGHLDLCPGCAKELEGLRNLTRLFQALPRPGLPAGFLLRLQSRRRAKEVRGPQPRTWVFAAAAVLAGLVVYQKSRQTPAPSPPLAVVPAPPAPQFPQSAPAGSPAYTNESLQGMLRQEGRRLGIAGVASKEERQERPDSSPFLGPRLGEPGTREEAEAAIRQLSAMRHSIEAQSGKREPVAIAGRTAPILAEQSSGGTSLEPLLTAEGSWSGQYSAASEETRTVSDLDSWRELWSRLSKSPPPELDFSRQQVAAVFLGPRPSGGYSVEIAGVDQNESILTVSFRERTPESGRPPTDGATSPYALKALPKSRLPVRFKKIP